jgi:molybdopterin-guanine dinucleotide biosynthesis protein A
MLLPHMLNLVIRRCAECIVVLNDPESWQDLPARLIQDDVLGAGPLGGLVAGLTAMHAEHALVLACDLPLIREPLLDALIAYPMQHDAIVPIHATHVGGRRLAEPLLAIYQRRCLPIAEACLNQGQYRLTAFLERLHVGYIEPSEWQQYDPTGQSFLNLNRPEDVVAMQALYTCRAD